MPKDHARKNDLADIKDLYGVKHADAIALLDHPDADERAMLCDYIETYDGIDTYKDAVAYLEQERNDPRNQLLCSTCGWTNGMICPECAGCGCYDDQCSGWRHHEYGAEMASATGDYEPGDYDDEGCEECGVGSGGNPYGQCVCEAA